MVPANNRPQVSFLIAHAESFSLWMPKMKDRPHLFTREFERHKPYFRLLTEESWYASPGFEDTKNEDLNIPPLSADTARSAPSACYAA